MEGDVELSRDKSGAEDYRTKADTSIPRPVAKLSGEGARAVRRRA